ncbi:MAG: ParA family protein [Ancalomicrobiaceae bacterium]|nr:ParA family protein [Ancalomicrobiaceae bacterium]
MSGSVITVASLKGGSGKTTLAISLAIHWLLHGRRAVLIDTDPRHAIVRLAARHLALGGIEVITDASLEVWQTAKTLAQDHDIVIVDTPSFRSDVTAAGLAVADTILLPLRPSPLDLDLMIDTVHMLRSGIRGWAPSMLCVLTQTVKDSIVVRRMRHDLHEAGIPTLHEEMQMRVAYPTAALQGATPSMLEPRGSAAHNVEAIAGEIESRLQPWRMAA